MTDQKDNELVKISKTREMATFVKILNESADSKNNITKQLVEFANNVLEILDCYELIMVKEQSSEVSKKLGIKGPDENKKT